ncbi:MAG: hypothetical protein L6R42_004785 [Xanthoria sp. 1 TBL-2021]|nr:MAG: hypothetical protein L6R42_004785 [Xanthoria sp. 1 TBL-2021]
MVLTRVSEPSDKAASIISPLDPNSDDGHTIRTKNFSSILHIRWACSNNVGFKFIQKAAIDDFCEKNAAYGDLTRLLGDKPAKALELSGWELDRGFSDLHQKMAAMKAELELIKAVKEDVF